MNEQQRGNGSFLSGMIFGVAVGAGIAFLLAPQTGEETRDLLRSRMREASEQAEDLYTKGKTVIENARGTMEATKEDEQGIAEREPEQVH